MNLKAGFVFLCLCLTLWTIPGWAHITPAGEKKEQAATGAAAEVEGRGEGFWPEAKEEAKEGEKKEEKKEDGCPATFGPIITDTAIPIEKGKFAIQPTWGLSFTTNNFTQSWRRVSAGGGRRTTEG